MKRKRFVIALLVLVAIFLAYMSFYLSYLSLLVGFIIAKYGGGKHSGKPGRVKSIIIHWQQYRLHMHHWVIAFLMGLVCALQGFYVITPQFFYGFLGGLVFQGIYCYDDWHRIIVRRRKAVPVPDAGL